VQKDGEENGIEISGALGVTVSLIFFHAHTSPSHNLRC
jgi:hypothetical protein